MKYDKVRSGMGSGKDITTNMNICSIWLFLELPFCFLFLG